MIKFDNGNNFRQLLVNAPQEIRDGAITGLHEALDD